MSYIRQTLGDRSWIKVGLDYAGPFTVLPNDMKYIILLIHYHLKWIYYSFTDAPNSESSIKFLDNVFILEGPPRDVVTDNGMHFLSNTFSHYLDSHNIKHLRVAFYYPSSNRLVERGNRIIKEGIQTTLASGHDVSKFIKNKVWSYNTSPLSTTGVSPFSL